MKRLIPVALAMLLAAVPAAYAQEKPDPPPAAQAKTPPPQVPLRVQVVVTKLLGEKTLSSIPYALSAVTHGGRTSLRMGVQVPVPDTKDGYTYRLVGTNIDCTAEVMPGNVYKLTLAISDSSVFNAPGGSDTPSGTAAASLRNFTANFNLLLRDGQTAQHTAATDPVSGETVRIDVSLAVLK